MGYIKQNFDTIQANQQPLEASHLIAIEDGILVNEEEIKQIREDIGSLEAMTLEPIDPTLKISGSIKGNIGSTLSISATAAYHYMLVDVGNMDSFYVETYMTTSKSYVYYGFAVDENNVILAQYGENTAFTNQLVSFTIDNLPENTSKIAVLAYTQSGGGIKIVPTVSEPTFIDTFNELTKKCNDTISTVDYFQNIIGDAEIVDADPINTSGALSGAIRGTYGGLLTTSATSAYNYIIVDVQDYVSFNVTTAVGASATYQHFAFAIAEDNTILGLYGENVDKVTKNISFVIDNLPRNTTKIAVLNHCQYANAEFTIIPQKRNVSFTGGTSVDSSFVNDLIATTDNIYTDDLVIEAGGIAGSTGINNSTMTACRTAGYIDVSSLEDNIVIDWELNDGIDPLTDVRIFYYDSAQAFISYKTGVSKGVPITKNGAHYIRLGFWNCAPESLNNRILIMSSSLYKGYYVPHEVIDISNTIGVNKDVQAALDEVTSADNIIKAIKAQLDTKRSLIVDRNADKKLFNLVHITDTHLSEIDDSGIIDVMTANQLASERWLDLVVHGGDIYNGYEIGSKTGDQGITRAKALTRIDNCLSNLKDVKCPIFVARGNHDVNDKYMPNYPNDTTVDSSERLPQTTFRLMTQWGFRGEIDGEYGCSFYKDFDDSKIRAILFDVYIANHQSPTCTAESMQFMVNALTLPEDKRDYSVVVFSHTIEGTAGTYLAPLFLAFKNGTTFETTVSKTTVSADFSTQGAGSFIGCICGHSHGEVENTSHGFWNIQTSTSYEKHNENVADNMYATVYSFDIDNHIIYKQKLGNNGRSSALNWDDLTSTEI